MSDDNTNLAMILVLAMKMKIPPKEFAKEIVNVKDSKEGKKYVEEVLEGLAENALEKIKEARELGNK